MTGCQFIVGLGLQPLRIALLKEKDSVAPLNKAALRSTSRLSICLILAESTKDCKKR